MAAIDPPGGEAATPERRRGLSRRSGDPTLVAAVAAFAVATTARLWWLDSLPAEWYGDISTLWEYAMATRHRHFPANLYNLGVGPLYPIVLSPVLALFGSSYLVVKLTAALWSLAGLGLLYWWGRELLGPWFAALATLIAGTGSWLLVFSRLGDIEAGTLSLAVGPVALASHVASERPARLWPAALCGLGAGACLYLYGAVFAVPILTTVAMVAWSIPGPPRGLPRSHLRAYLAGLGAALLPMLIAVVRSAQAFREGHFATRMVGGSGWLDTLTNNVRMATMAYLTKGDGNGRGNPMDLPHIDRLGLVLAAIGVVFWMRPARWRQGALLLGGFLLMHLPVVLTNDAIEPSASRSIAAAPFLYLLVASGIWGLLRLVGRGGRRTVVAATAAVVLAAAFAAIELQRYFVTYRRQLPYDNVPVARRITDFVDALPAATSIHLIGSTWAPGFMPEPKSIHYTMRRPERFHEESVSDFDCARLAELPRPAVLIWSYDSVLPSPALAPCADALETELFSTTDGHRLFHAATLGPGAPPHG